MVKISGLAAPPGGQRRQLEILAQQLPAQQRQERRQAGILDDGAAQSIGENDMAAARRLQQAGNAQQGIAAQFQRIAVGVHHPPQDDVHRPQPAQGFQPDPAVAHHQILALDQTERQVVGQIGMFEINRAVGAGGQQHHMGVFGMMAGQPGQGGALGFQKRGQPAQWRVAVQHRQAPAPE